MLQSYLLIYNPEADACYKLYKAGAESYYNIYNSETDTKDYDSETDACYRLHNPESDACYKVTYLLITLRLTLVTSYIMPESFSNIYNSEAGKKDYDSEAYACYKLYNPETDACYKLHNPEADACYDVTYLLITLRLTLVTNYITI